MIIGLDVMKGMKIPVVKVGRIRPTSVKFTLGLPDWLFHPLLPVIIKVDAKGKAKNRL